MYNTLVHEALIFHIRQTKKARVSQALCRRFRCSPDFIPLCFSLYAGWDTSNIKLNFESRKKE